MNIHKGGLLSRKSVATLGACLAVSSLLLWPGRVDAQIINLSDNGSTASVNLTSGAGMYNWSVLGQNQLMQQWFWYRIDGGVAQPINTLGLAGYEVTGNNVLDVLYQSDKLSIEVVYTLTGTGSGEADMMENIYAVNFAGTNVTLNLYEYSYFNLLQSDYNSVTIFEDLDYGGYNRVRQTSGSTAIEEAIASPNANRAEAADFDQTLNALNTQSGLLLNNNLTAGAGKVTWSFQWTKELTPGNEFDIFKDKSLSIQIVPEPGTTALALLGLCLAGWTLRRRHA
jgi:hypothetical protein